MKERRCELDLSVEALADELGMHAGALRGVESSGRVMSLRKIRKTERLLKLRVGALYPVLAGGEGVPDEPPPQPKPKPKPPPRKDRTPRPPRPASELDVA